MNLDSGRRQRFKTSKQGHPAAPRLAAAQYTYVRTFNLQTSTYKGEAGPAAPKQLASRYSRFVPSVSLREGGSSSAAEVAKPVEPYRIWRATAADAEQVASVCAEVGGTVFASLHACMLAASPPTGLRTHDAAHPAAARAAPTTPLHLSEGYHLLSVSCTVPPTRILKPSRLHGI